jgi:hypothetical protein
MALVLAVVVAACGGDDDSGGVIEEAVVRPGITAMEQASALACSSDAQTITVAIESYTMLEGDPPPDEAALIAAQYVREDSQLWDVANGQLVAVAPECGAASPAITAPSTDVGQIVTSTEAPLTPDQMLAQLSEAEIAEVGGVECATELVHIFAATEQFMVENATDPESLQQLLDAGYLDAPIVLWEVVDDELRPAPDSPCVALDA